VSGDDTTPAAEAADLPEIQQRAQAHSVRLLVLHQQIARAKAAYERASTDAYPDFALLRNAGIPQLAPNLGQGRAGLLTVLDGGKTVVVDEDELLLLYALNSATDLEDYVLPAAFEDERVVKLIAEHFPEFVQARIKKAVRADVDEQIDRTDGWVATPGTGEPVKVATVTRHQANGKFQVRPDQRAQQMISAAIEAGLITEDGAIVAPGSDEK